MSAASSLSDSGGTLASLTSQPRISLRFLAIFGGNLMRHWLMLVLPALAFVAPQPVHAEMFGEGYKPCGDQPSTMDIVACVQAKAKVWDDRLNAAYGDLRKRITPDQLQPLQQAELAWIQYRDANCSFYYTAQGSIRQVQAAECMRSMTQDRALELEKAMKLGD